MSESVTIPPLRPGQPPLSILVDYDGTIALTDVSDTLLAAHAAPGWEALERRFGEGRIGSRRLLQLELALLPPDEDLLVATAARQPHDPAFPGFVRLARSWEIPVEVVSDGFGFFIAPALARLGVPDLPVVTNRTVFGLDGAHLEWPFGHPDCFVCGTCKRARVLAHQATGRAVVYVGDGRSDRFAAGYADLVFAKEELAALCQAEGWAWRPWRDFAELTAWLEATLHQWRGDPASLPGPRPRRPYCGPEVWGPGAQDLPRA
jgi:2-hydroxy-3-keto-5-methylthiopentenyl-1-phosphate phosphatase